MSVFSPYENPVFCGKKLNLQPIRPEICQHYPVYRPKDTIFAYAAWPTVTRDENGTPRLLPLPRIMFVPLPRRLCM